MVVDTNVDGVGVVAVGLNVVDEEVLGHIEDLVDLSPVFAAVFGHLDQAVIGPNVDQAFDVWLFVNGGNIAVLGHCK